MASGMPKTKRSFKSLSIDTKIEILEQIGRVSYPVLAEKYGVGTSTISDIRKNSIKLKEFKRKMVEMGFKRPAMALRMGKDEQLEEAVFLWFRQKREQGIPITGGASCNINTSH